MKKERKNVILVSDSMLNNISERGLSNNNLVKVKSFSGATNKKVNEEIDVHTQHINSTC